MHQCSTGQYNIFIQRTQLIIYISQPQLFTWHKKNVYVYSYYPQCSDQNVSALRPTSLPKHVLRCHIPRQTCCLWRSSQWYQSTITMTKSFIWTRHLDERQACHGLFITHDTSLATSIYLQQWMPADVWSVNYFTTNWYLGRKEVYYYDTKQPRTYGFNALVADTAANLWRFVTTVESYQHNVQHCHFYNEIIWRLCR